MEQKENTLSGNPSVFSSTKRFGVNGIKYFTLVILLFGIINTTFLIIALIKFKTIESFGTYIGCIASIIVIGLLFNALGIFLTYKYLLNDGLSVIYKHSQPLFKKLSSIIVDKTAFVATDKMKIKDTHIDKTFEIGNVITETYGKKVPKVARKGIGYLVGKIPFNELIFNIADSIKDRDKDRAEDLLFNEIDLYITSSILGNNSMKFMYWIIPLNIIIQAIAICIISNNIAPQTFYF